MGGGEGDGMIGLVVATHGDLGAALLRATEMILGPQPRMAALSLQMADGVDEASSRLDEALKRVGGGKGVLILTDMLGGTPSNLCLSLMDAQTVEVVSGVNLPMLLKAVQIRAGVELAEAAVQVKKHGRSSILVASEVLEGRER